MPIGEAGIALATQAAHWLERFYPGTSVTLSECNVELTADRIDGILLERAWQAALHNERVYLANANKRRALLEGLIA